MKRRIVKKVAKRFSDGKGILQKYVLSVDEYKVNDTHYWKTELVVPFPLQEAIHLEAKRRGWDGCHWTDPLVLSVEHEEAV